MSRLLSLAVCLVSITILTGWTMPIPQVSADHVTSTYLRAHFSAWNVSQPSGSNPLIIVLSSSSLRIGSPPRAPAFTVTIERVDTSFRHNFAIYPQGTTPATGTAIDRTVDVTSASPIASDSFSLPTGIYEYYCEYHSGQMHGQIKAINPDVDKDGDVDIDDLIDTFLNQFTTSPQNDIDQDGDVDIDDLIDVFLHQFIS